MSMSVEVQEVRGVREPLVSKPLDEATWQTWVEKGRAQEERSHAVRMGAVKWMSLAGLLFATTVGLWSRLTPYDVGVRFLVAVGAIVLMFQAFHTRNYAFGAVFGALALLYNPVAPVFSFSGEWQRAFVVASAVPFVASLTWRNAKLVPMSKLSLIVSKLTLTSLFVCGMISAASVAGDLSKYRGFQFGTDLPTVTKQVGASVSQAKVTHSRPALIQELKWRPQSLGPSTQKESANEVVFSFYNGELYRIAISYDRYEIEGLTTDDIIEAVSTIYGPAARVAIPVKSPENHYSDQDEVVARWQDPQYSFDLVRASYGPTFKLIGILKRLDAPAQAAIHEATRLDIEEAPQRDAARRASEQEAVRAKLEKSRLVNKPRFRP